MYFQSLPYAPLRITSRFGPRNTGIAGASTYHYGIDLGAYKALYPSATYGGPVMSVLPGTVTTSAYNSTRGYYVIVDHGVIDGRSVRTLYQHLRSSGLAVGRIVRPGEWVGDMGATGTVSAIHLHFELHFNNTPVNPEPYLYDIREDQEDDEEEEQEMIFTTISELPEWARPAIRTGVNNGWIATNSSGQFSIYESNLQTAAWFYTTGLWDRQRPTSDEASSWAQGAVDRAVEAGVIVGDGSGNLQLHTPITREETLVFLDRVGAFSGEGTTPIGGGVDDDDDDHHHHDHHHHDHDHDHDDDHDHDHDNDHDDDDNDHQCNCIRRPLRYRCRYGFETEVPETAVFEDESDVFTDTTIAARRRFAQRRDFS